MINLRSFEVPTVVKHALGAIACLADEVKALGMQRPMIVTDSGLVRIGLADEVMNLLKAANLDFYCFDEVIPNPPIALVDRGAEIYARERCDGLIGLGGGSSIDTAKSIGVVAAHGGSIGAFEWASPNPIQKRIPPLIAVPTTFGHRQRSNAVGRDHRPRAQDQIQCGRHRADRRPCRPARSVVDAQSARLCHCRHGHGCAGARDRMLYLCLCPGLARCRSVASDGVCGRLFARCLCPRP